MASLEIIDPAQKRHELYMHIAKQLANSPSFTCAESPAEQVEQMMQLLQGLKILPLIEMLASLGAISFSRVRSQVSRAPYLPTLTTSNLPYALLLPPLLPPAP